MAGAIAVTGALVPAGMMFNMVQPNSATRLSSLWHRAISHSLGVKSTFSGTLATGSVLYVCNHLSWLDIPVLGSRLHASFVAKSEVGSMPFVGFLARFQQTIYVERERRSRAPEQSGSIRARLIAGDNVILFPEGTSSDGVQVLPFKSALFAVAEDDAIRIQPISLAYTHLNGMPITRQRRPDIAWIGDMRFGSHAVDFMRLGRTSAAILCHPPVRRADFSDRKALARYCQEQVAQGYRQLIRGQA